MALSLVEPTKPAGAMFKTRPLLPNLGVEVLDFDFSAAMDQAKAQAIQDLSDRHLVLLFRGQKVTEAQQVAFTGALGPMIPPVEPAFTSTTNRMIFRLGNVDMAGNKLALDDPGTVYTYGPEKWHSDGAYKPVPSHLSVLHALEIPPEGGETWFASMVNAYEALSPALKARIANLKMEHPYPNSGQKVKDWQGTKVDLVVHPLVREIPGGQKALFISAFGGHILGLPDAESDALSKELMDFATSGAFTYKHQWTLGDTLMWNNRGLLHSAQPWDRVKYRRLLQRTEVTDTLGYSQAS